MHFQRLRLSGFKSFVDPSEFRIEAGLTGVVGPNGCGKSNLLEALRWVMGANSAKAMRAGGMDDVIFAGASGRPARNHAEVALTIDNSDRTAPAAFNDHPVLEVVRRIDRGAGSTYRINGREVRARDVQLLFADASTGSNSPALVRQGQISELIAARPQNRRLILEEAAGVSGLHTRRHEAELRLRAAEANLARLDDVGQELETQLGRLRREARQAERFRRLASDVRTLQGALLYARWNEAREAAVKLRGELSVADDRVETAVRTAVRTTTEAEAAAARTPPLREAEMVAAAVLARLAIEKDRLDREAESLEQTLQRLRTEHQRLDADRARETQVVEDAHQSLDRLLPELAALEREIAEAPTRGPELQAQLEAYEAARAACEAEVERLASRLAAQEASRRAATARLQEAETRHARLATAEAKARAERQSLALGPSQGLLDARSRLETAQAHMRDAQLRLEAAEETRSVAAAAEAGRREAARRLEDQLGGLKAEARALAQVAAPQRRSGFPPALEQVAPERGYEAAVAAALGDDLEAALDPQAPAHWGGAPLPPAPQWPRGVEPLGAYVSAPEALQARLVLVGLVEAGEGPALQSQLSAGQRLVSKAGDLWRWDGYTSRAAAPRPAAVRLEQRTRLLELEGRIETLSPQVQAAKDAHQAAQIDLSAAEIAQKEARRALPGTEQQTAQARLEVERLERLYAQQEAQARALDQVLERYGVEMDEARRSLEAIRAESMGSDDPNLGAQLQAAREAAGPAREAAARARSALEAEIRETESRERRLAALVKDRDAWARRAKAAIQRLETLSEERERCVAELNAALDRPADLDDRRLRLEGEIAEAERRRTEAAEALQAAETRRGELERALKAQEAEASAAREARAALGARLEAGRERLMELTREIRETTQLEPEGLARRLAEDAVAIPSDISGLETHLQNLERQRDAIGAVNLRAEEEAAEYAARLELMMTERTDLTGAIARLRQGIDELNTEGRGRLLAAFEVIDAHFRTLFEALFEGGQAELRLVESPDPLEAGLEIYACPPGKRLSTMSLMSGGEQALTAAALIFAVFLARPAPICVLDEVDAPLDDANVDRFCNMLDEMRRRTQTRFITITHNPVTMARMDRLFGVTMAERGVSQLVSVDLRQAEALAAE